MPGSAPPAPLTGALRRRRWAAGVLASGFVLSCGSHAEEEDLEIAPATPGYPETTSRLTLRLSPKLQKRCHATLVHPRWALTAAHCFSNLEPDARGALNEFERNISAAEAVFFPGAHPSLASRRDAVWASSEFVAAHDLALVPIDPAIEDVAPVTLWAPNHECRWRGGAEPLGLFGQQDPLEQAQTAEAVITGEVEADVLLGPGHSGVLLSAEGARVRPGDSGSGMTIQASARDEVAPGCQPSPGSSPEILVGVIQNADPDALGLPFGLVPLHTLEHAQWIAEVLAAPAPTHGRPTLDPDPGYY